MSCTRTWHQAEAEEYELVDNLDKREVFRCTELPKAWHRAKVVNSQLIDNLKKNVFCCTALPKASHRNKANKMQRASMLDRPRATSVGLQSRVGWLELACLQRLPRGDIKGDAQTHQHAPLEGRHCPRATPAQHRASQVPVPVHVSLYNMGRLSCVPQRCQRA